MTELKATPSGAMLQEHEEGAYASLRDITAYFGEAFDEADPARVLRIVRDFLGLYEKALAELEVRPESEGIGFDA